MKNYKVGLHILIWLMVFLNDFLPKYLDNSFQSYAKNGVENGAFLNYFLVCLGYLLSNIICFYTTAFVIGPLFLRKKWIKATLISLILLLFIPTYRYVTEYYLFLPYLRFDNYFGKMPTSFWYIKNSILYTFSSSVVYGIIYFVVNEWYANNQKQRELAQETIKSELAFLKSQINPHFLFNTLNDIYVLTYHQSPKAPDAVLKLSELLRYMLKESDEQFVALHKEIEYLKNVIDLFQIGQKGAAFINFKLEGEVITQQIAPLILINFIENAFKHGVTTDPLQPIQIKLDVNLEEMQLYISNQKNQDFKDKMGGIGLVNVKRRLELLYPNRHVLVIKDEIDTFTIQLSIKWN